VAGYLRAGTAAFVQRLRAGQELQSLDLIGHDGEVDRMHSCFPSKLWLFSDIGGSLIPVNVKIGSQNLLLDWLAVASF
jgi:hypothetical protein